MLARHASHLDNLASRGLLLLHKLSSAQLLLGEGFDRSTRGAVEGTGNELNVGSLDVLHHQDLHVRKELERDVVDGIAENGLLNEKNIAAGLLDLLAHLENVSLLLIDESIHLSIVIEDHRVFDV